MPGSGSGNKRIEITDLERAEETDILQAESFLARDSHEMVRHHVSQDLRGAWANNPGLVAPFVAVPAPTDFIVAQDCFSGLMVRPDSATSLAIDPGEMGAFFPTYPNTTGDDSQYVAISSVGLPTPNAIITFLANAGPGVRWDIIECQPTEVLVSSAVRGVFTPPAGPFTPTNLPKVRGGELTFRIRRGVAGSGIPSIDPDWMPLAAVHVRTDSTSFLNCDVYDIRPLVAERCPFGIRHPISPPGTNLCYRSELYECELSAFSIGGVNGMVSAGYFRGHFGGYWSGGVIQKNLPASNAANFGDTSVTGGSYAFFNWEDPLNRDAAFVAAANATWHLKCVFPRGYPRWVRYSQNALVAGASNRLRVSGRLPQGPRGILVASKFQGLRNGIYTPGTMPAAFGDAAAIEWGHAVSAGIFDGIVASALYPAIGGSFDKKYSFVTEGNLAILSPVTLVGSLPSASTWRLDGTLDTTIIPVWCRAVLVEFSFTWVTGAGGGEIDFTNTKAALAASAANGVQIPFSSSRMIVPAGEVNWFATHSLWVPLWPATGGYDQGGGPSTALRFEGFNIAPGLLVSVACVARIKGYQA